MNINKLTDSIVSVNGTLQAKAKSAVNMALTVRNWLIGLYIVEFEQHGEDRAKYGTELLHTLSENIAKRGVEGFSATNLRLFRQFYDCYPEIIYLFAKNTTNPILLTASNELQKSGIPIIQSLTEESQNNENQIIQTVSEESENSEIQIHQSATDEFQHTENQLNTDLKIKLAAEMLQSLSFTHITLMLPLDNPLKRSFYAVEAMKGVWSVRD